MAPGRRCTGVILAGGQSARFGGEPKGLALIAGMRMIDRAAAALAEASDDQLVVANAAGANAWLPGVTTVCDVRPGLGALGGVHAALHHTTSDVVVLAWDAPFVPGAQIGRAHV